MIQSPRSETTSLTSPGCWVLYSVSNYLSSLEFNPWRMISLSLKTWSRCYRTTTDTTIPTPLRLWIYRDTNGKVFRQDPLRSYVRVRCHPLQLSMLLVGASTVSLRAYLVPSPINGNGRISMPRQKNTQMPDIRSYSISKLTAPPFLFNCLFAKPP